MHNECSSSAKIQHHAVNGEQHDTAKISFPDLDLDLLQVSVLVHVTVPMRTFNCTHSCAAAVKPL